MRTEHTLERLCFELTQNCGDEYEACRQVGVSLIFLRQWCKDDAKVAERVNEAARVGNAGLVSAAIKRAVNGVEEDVYFKGLVVGQKTNYSDGLLTTLLKAKVPEFGKDAENGIHVNVNVANIMPRADSYEQWLEMKNVTLAPPKPRTEEIVDAEFTAIPSDREKSLEAIASLMGTPAPQPQLADLL